MVEINSRLLCLLGYLVLVTSASAEPALAGEGLNERTPISQSRNVKINTRNGQGVVFPLTKRARPPMRAGLLSAKEIAELDTTTDLDGLRDFREKLQDKYSDRFEDGGQRVRARRAAEELELQERKRKRSSETVAMTNNNWDVTYSTTILLGTPPKPYQVILDTGSSDAWVTSNQCNACTGGNSWDPSTSSTWTPRQKLLSINYGSGNVAGRTGSDVLQMGSFSISDQVLGLVDSAGAVLPGVTEGLMGLGFGRIAKSGGTPFWLRLAGGDAANSGGNLDAPLFSFWFSR